MAVIAPSWSFQDRSQGTGTELGSRPPPGSGLPHQRRRRRSLRRRRRPHLHLGHQRRERLPGPGQPRDQQDDVVVPRVADGILRVLDEEPVARGEEHLGDRAAVVRRQVLPARRGVSSLPELPVRLPRALTGRRSPGRRPRCRSPRSALAKSVAVHQRSGRCRRRCRSRTWLRRAAYRGTEISVP